MSDKHLEHLVNVISDDSSKTGKEAKFATLLANPLGMTLVYHTYSPFRNWGLTFKVKPPAGVENGLDDQFMDLIPLLNQLADRQLTGNAAKQAVEDTFKELNPAAAKLLWWILNKDLKAGVGPTLIKKLSPGLIPFFSVMRAETYDPKYIKDGDFPVAVEPKIDGYRLTFIAKDGVGSFYTRAGKPLPAVDYMIAPVMELVNSMNLGDVMIDGEIKTNDNFEEMSGALRRTKEDAQDAVFYMFDAMSLYDFELDGTNDTPYGDRRKDVVRMAEDAEHIDLGDKLKAPEMVLAYSHDEILSLYETYREQGYEGAMVKPLNHGYDKKKTRGWLKVKPKDTEDLPIVGYFPGEPNTKYEHTLGGIIVDRKGVEVRVYSGINDVLREEIWNNKDKYLNVLAEIEFQEETAAGSLRHARVIQLRLDKTGEN